MRPPVDVSYTAQLLLRPCKTCDGKVRGKAVVVIGE